VSATGSDVPASPPTDVTASVLPPPSVPTSAGVPAQLGELAVLDAALDDAGTLILEPALSLFAAGYAPVPRITAAAQPLIDGGPALRTILANLGQLADDQLAAVSRVVDQPGVALADVASGGSPLLQAAGQHVTTAMSSFVQSQDRALPDDVRITLVELPYDNGDGTRNFSDAASFATALPFTQSPDVAFDECRIRINATAPLDAVAGTADPAFISAIAQETFHCLQFGLVPAGAGVPQWVMEGAAAFAGEDVAGGSRLSAAWWERWIAQPERPLDRRTYDAAGFFFLLRDLADPYAFADAFLTDPSPSSIRRRLEQTPLFDRWGTQYAMEPTWGPTYTVVGDGAPTVPAPQQTMALSVDGPRVAAAGLTATTELSASAYRFAVPGDVLVVTAGPADRGGLRFLDGTEHPLAEATQAFCLNPQGCACPGVPPESSTATAVASTEVFIGVGPSSGGGPELAARSLGQWCNEVLVPAPADGALDECLSRQWVSTGYVVPQTAGVLQETTGGAGALLQLRPDLEAVVSMDDTTPVVVTATDATGAVTTTTLEYRGRGTGTWSAENGVIDVAGVDTASFTVRVSIETLAAGPLADDKIAATDVRLAGYASLLGTGRYACSPVEMTLTHVTPSIGGEAGFAFAPA